LDQKAQIESDNPKFSTLGPTAYS